MGRIRVLPDHLANQIAAGEVVERPAAALKELLENSFDAGAKKIRIFLEAGGKKRIRVEDDGHGMDRDDCLMALERHATSKLTRAEDLFSINTLGFRGEAIPSIASVSRFTLESRVAEAETGVRIETRGSQLSKVSEVSRNPGTTVTIDNLFFNIPARKKFLRTSETELSRMVHLITQYSLAHIDIHFYVEHNGKTLSDLPPVNTLKERIYQHYGKRMLDELIPVSANPDWLSIEGLTSTPSFFKTNRMYQYLFVNGRLVRDKVLSHAIAAAYEGFGEGRVYPVVFLFIDLPSTEVDVNVHPAKTEVKFIHGGFVHDSVRDAIREPLVRAKPTIAYRFRQGYHAHPSGATAPPKEGETSPPTRAPDPWSRPAARQEYLPGADPISQSPLFSQAPAEPTQPGSSAYERFMARNRDLLEQGQPPPIQTGPDPKADAPDLFSHNQSLALPVVIGQFRESYILAEQEGDLLLIDQHVVHERILYDKISAELKKSEVERQPLLVPVTIELTPPQAVALEQLTPQISAFGFELEPYGGHTFIIREIPVFVTGQNLERHVVEIIEKAQGQRTDTILETMTEHFAATKACKAAVKVNMRLTMDKMNHLIETLWASSSPLFCPHGRPIILRFRNEEIEKNFLRR